MVNKPSPTTPFYALALKLFTDTQQAQIEKGLRKYPEPFNPQSWTPQELLNHALEETVDLTHYLVGLKTLLDDKDDTIRQLNKQVSDLKRELTLARMPKSKGTKTRRLICTPVVPYKSPFEDLAPKPPYADIDD